MLSDYTLRNHPTMIPKKKSQKSSSKETDEAVSIVATSQGEPMAPGIAYFAKLQAGTPHDFVKTLFPQLQSASDEQVKQVTEIIGGLLSGVPGYDFGVHVPDWVKAASKNCLELLGIDFNELQNGNLAEMGKIIGLMENTSEIEAPSEMKSAAKNIVEIARNDAAKSPAKDAVDFFTGVQSAEKIRGGMEQPPRRKKIFAVIATMWRQVEKLESAGQLHRLLLDLNVIDSGTDQAETRKVCRLIGLKFRDKAGRPPDQK